MTWKEEYKSRVTSAEDALKAIRSGDRVVIPIGCNPQALGDTLVGRMDELDGVELAHTATGWPYIWLQPGMAGSFNIIHEHWASPLASEALKARHHDFLPAPFSLRFKGGESGRSPSEGRDPDVVMVQVTPPDENGMVNLGPHLWNQKEYIARARCALAEVSNRIPRCEGDTELPVDAFTHFVEFDSPSLAARHLRPGPAVQAIAKYVGELVRDGDTLQIGGGSTSFGVAYCKPFDDKHDLGWHAEITPSPIVRLVRDGVMTGARKTVDQGKAVSCGIVGDEEDWSFLQGNPAIELQSCSYVLDPRNVAGNDNMVAINAALMVDLTGQIASESLGPTMISGTGGLLEVVIGTLWSKGGRSITVLPSTNPIPDDSSRAESDPGSNPALDHDQQQTATRIVPMLPEGTVVSVPRLLADIVVTEHGVARLMGKSIRERADELIAIADPAHRAELKAAAQRLFYP